MKYSICGMLDTADGTGVVDLINRYSLWRLITDQSDVFSFEAWVNTAVDKDSLFAELKPAVDTYSGSISWHECTHDEAAPQPCIIAETYVRG